MTTPAAQRRQWPLRTRLTALVVLISALALAAVNVLLPVQLRSNLLNTKENALRSVVAQLQKKVSRPSDMIQAASPYRDSSVMVVQPNGEVVTRDANLVPSEVPQVGADILRSGVVQTAWNSTGNIEFRTLAYPAKDNDTGADLYVVAWVQIEDVKSTVGTIIVTEILISVGLLILIGFASSVIVRRALRPLVSMAGAADEIATGNLNRRVHPGPPGTEVGRLGVAFNEMLDGISALLTDREKGEQRMRQFLADASHELRTPVAAVRGYTDLYAAGALPDQAAVDRAMERMGFEADRMGALVGDLLTLVQADAPQTEQYAAVDVAEVLTGVVDDAAVIDCSRTWRLAAVEPGSGVLVWGDRLRLHQLFANLLSNVRTHTDPGTVATVTVRTTSTEVAVVVSDNGPGVRDADLPKLFDRFYRVDTSRSRVRGGTGLGLSIVAAIVRGHQGWIQASHTPGGGLTTTIVLPRYQPETSQHLTGEHPRSWVTSVTGGTQMTELVASAKRADESAASGTDDRPAALPQHAG